MTGAIQLDRLPPPDVVDPSTFEQEYAKAKAKFAELWDAQRKKDPALPAIDLTLESEPIVKQLQAFAYLSLMLRQRVNDAARANFLATAKRKDLDNLGAFYGVERLILRPAQPELGIDAVYESDDDYRERITLAPGSFSVAGPEQAYVFHARSASGDVLHASATSPEPSVVVVSILARHGDGTASEELIKKVSDALTSDAVRPLTDQVFVQSAQIIRYRVRATLFSYAGPDPSIAMDAAKAALDAYRTESRRLGRSVTLAGIYAALKAPGIQNVKLEEPTADVVVDETQAAYCAPEDIDLTYGGIGA
jgi:phage-related baseplate assembly protein